MPASASQELGVKANAITIQQRISRIHFFKARLEMAWWLSALGVLAEDPDSVLSNHMSPNHL